MSKSQIICCGQTKAEIQSPRVNSTVIHGHGASQLQCPLWLIVSGRLSGHKFRPIRRRWRRDRLRNCRHFRPDLFTRERRIVPAASLLACTGKIQHQG